MRERKRSADEGYMQIKVQGINRAQRLNSDALSSPKGRENRSEVVPSSMSKHFVNTGYIRAEPGRQFSPVRTANTHTVRSLIKRADVRSRQMREKRKTQMEELQIQNLEGISFHKKKNSLNPDIGLTQEEARQENAHVGCQTFSGFSGPRSTQHSFRRPPQTQATVTSEVSPISKRFTAQIRSRPKQDRLENSLGSKEKRVYTRSLRQRSVNESDNARLAEFLTMKESVLEAITQFRRRETRKRKDDEMLPHLSQIKPVTFSTGIKFRNKSEQHRYQRNVKKASNIDSLVSNERPLAKKHVAQFLRNYMNLSDGSDDEELVEKFKHFVQSQKKDEKVNLQNEKTLDEIIQTCCKPTSLIFRYT